MKQRIEIYCLFILMKKKNSRKKIIKRKELITHIAFFCFIGGTTQCASGIRVVKSYDEPLQLWDCVDYRIFYI